MTMMRTLLRATPAAVAMALGAATAAMAQAEIQNFEDSISIPVPATLVLLGAALGGKILVDVLRARRR